MVWDRRAIEEEAKGLETFKGIISKDVNQIN